ncbi:J domain-containing protein [Vulgatibacter sp.]|uniref:J domain-containing protein n=1 Tax=Vulgatibacter sp. TaxID=1971226 RepID=UPI00356349A4
MSSTAAADGGRYYSCPRCTRTYASIYSETIRKAAGVRTPASAASTRPDEKFAEAKRRLEAWLRRLDEQDPFFVLGVRPGANMDQVRSRYRELALVHHPDRGGDERQMRRILRAYDQIRVLHATGRAPKGEPKRIAAPLVDEEV